MVLTNTPGVLDKSGKLLTGLTPKKIDTLVADGTLSGGMLPKLEACTDALRHGVGRVRILPAAQVEVLPQLYFSKIDYGTEVTVQ